MNNTRRKELTEIVSKLSDLKDQLDLLQTEEQDYFDNMPESLQESEKGYSAAAAADNLSEAVQNIEDSMDAITAAIE